MTGGAAGPRPLRPHDGCCDACRRLNVRAVDAVEESTAALRGFLRVERDSLPQDSPGDMAEALVPVAAALACIVRGDGGAVDVAYLLRRLSSAERDALLVVLAGLVDPDTSVRDALGWVTWDDAGRRLDELPALHGTLRQLGDEYMAWKCVPSGVRQVLDDEKRMQALYMFDHGLRAVEIASRLGVGEQTVRGWLKRRVA